jgi:protein-arginine kinase activator protein McsA
MDKAQAARDRLKEAFRQLKSEMKCSRCPETHVAALQFHHTDPSKKEFSISMAVQSNWSKDRIMNEIAKCEVLCANCHLKHHWSERHASDLPMEVTANAHQGVPEQDRTP